MRYAFIQEHLQLWHVGRVCKVLPVHPIGFYAWQQAPVSERAKDDQRALGMIKQSWLEGGAVYGYRKITCDLRDLGEACGKHRVARLMRNEGLRSKTGYGRRPCGRSGEPSDVSPNHLQRQFDVQVNIGTKSTTDFHPQNTSNSPLKNTTNSHVKVTS